MIGNGSDNNHFNLMFTTKGLIQHADSSFDGCFHIDATYKLLKLGYPLMVFGRSDKNRAFHPVTFCLTSHETQIDFENFYNDIIDLCMQLDIEFDPIYLMQNAYVASYNAAKECLPSVQVLMCFYHVIANVRSHKHLIPKNMYDDGLNAVRAIHMSCSEEEWNDSCDKFRKKWKKKAADFYNYVKKS